MLRQTLMANLRLVSYNAGQTVCDQSTVCSWFGVVLEGSLVGWEQRHGSGMMLHLQWHLHARRDPLCVALTVCRWQLPM